MKPMFSLTFLFSLITLSLLFAIDLNASSYSIPLDYTYLETNRPLLATEEQEENPELKKAHENWATEVASGVALRDL